MTREQVEKLAPKNAITRAVGVYEHCEPESLVLDVTEGDRFLLCTDGLSQYFEDDTAGLARGLGEPDANVAVKHLIDTANERGGSDNITAILVTLGEAGPATRTVRRSSSSSASSWLGCPCSGR